MSAVDIDVEVLTIRERLELIEKLEASLPGAYDPFTPEIMEVLKEREAAAERGENPAFPADEVMARLLRKYQR
jgi:hypothetical protein